MRCFENFSHLSITLRKRNTMLKFGVLVTLLVAAEGIQPKRYDNYKVFRVTPKNQEQSDLLNHLSQVAEYSFWNGPHFTNASSDVMVPPSKLLDFERLMKITETPHEIHIDNVQSLMDQENPMLNKIIRAGFNWRTYNSLDEIYSWMDSLAKTYPDKVKVVSPGKTYEGREIKGVQLSFKKGNPGIFIEGNIHAREWITSATVTYILNQLLTSKDPEVRELAEANDWYIFPVFNPDGFVYTHTTDRLWRKTRKPYTSLCYGSDPNRNWGYKWMQGGASSFPCSETFAGSAAFSEVETETMAKYLTSISNDIYAYISFHSYSQLLLFPYGHTTDHLDNHDQLLAIGKQTIQALAKRYGTQYVTGNIAETIYVASGSSMDWMKGTFKTPVTYTYELRDKGRYGFLLPPSQIIPTGEETLDSLVGLFKAAKAYGIPNRTVVH